MTILAVKSELKSCLNYMETLHVYTPFFLVKNRAGCSQIRLFAFRGGFLPPRTSVTSRGSSHAIPANLVFQQRKSLPARQFYTILFTLSHARITLSRTKFLSKLPVAAQFLGHGTNPPRIIQSLQSGVVAP